MSRCIRHSLVRSYTTVAGGCVRCACHLLRIWCPTCNVPSCKANTCGHSHPVKQLRERSQAPDVNLFRPLALMEGSVLAQISSMSSCVLTIQVHAGCARRHEAAQ